ncbi:hypothetical protein BESB_021530 [Besnoitia besnoiti]|uniref:Uncharacterized protein n=1 Tax=Besnoitia besnoiti TaxID=94643 RepID=A0A2A9MA03_BESBE|nr:hypothetical protein BESB_021530 [Besnoitia besnoiti]PFH32212.1 hypothetical protein BESB_021530 [Besnoitia besnoiti]
MGLYCIASLLLAVYPERAYETRSSLIGELKDAILVGTRAARAESGFGYETRQPESGAPSAKNHVVRHLRAFPSRISPSGATALAFPVGSGRRITTTDTSQMSSAHPANASEPELSEPSANLPPTSSRSHKEAPTSEWQPKEEHNQAHALSGTDTAKIGRSKSTAKTASSPSVRSWCTASDTCSSGSLRSSSYHPAYSKCSRETAKESSSTSPVRAPA